MCFYATDARVGEEDAEPNRAIGVLRSFCSIFRVGGLKKRILSFVRLMEILKYGRPPSQWPNRPCGSFDSGPKKKMEMKTNGRKQV